MNENTTTPGKSQTFVKQSELRGFKEHKALIHILEKQEGVSEKSINKAAGLMSGGNVPTDLERKYDIKFIRHWVRKMAPDGSRYSLYQLLNSDQAKKLVALIKRHCQTHRIDPPHAELLEQLVMNIPDRSCDNAA
ncbi:MAG: hypothetical protein V7752_17545 [Halopseudomonas sp.]